MKVYVAIGHDYNSTTVLGVFSTKDKANLCIDKCSESYDSCSVEEHEVEI